MRDGQLLKVQRITDEKLINDLFQVVLAKPVEPREEGRKPEVTNEAPISAGNSVSTTLPETP